MSNVKTNAGIKTSFAVFLFLSLFGSARAYSAVTGASIVSWITIVSGVLNPILQMFVSLTTIGVGLTTIYIAHRSFKKLEDEKDD